ncbi:porin [Shewanella youngdeokensis]|uniref:Porin n=1 Tax=Shewanella youngdeokensis TaxID=2999068 RepID=A0ABZ0JYA6_9GAMM|nr:porin [Shewanella sp. DAU334]
MKLNYLAIACLIASASPLTVLAESFNNNFYGEAQGQSTWQTGKDYQTEVQQLKAGLSGLYKTDNLKVKYDAEAQYSDNFSDRGYDDIEVTIARAIFLTNYGAVVVGKGYSGVYSEIYQRVDIHQSNNAELASSNKMLWDQVTYTDNIFAYATPKFDLASGKIKFVAAIVSLKNDNGSDGDVLSARIVYNSSSFNTSAGYVRVDKSYPAVDKENDYERFSIGADYQLGNVTVAGLVELNEHAFSKNENTYVGAVKYRLNDFDFGVSYQHKTYTDEWKDDSQALLIGSVNYHYSKALSFFVEASFFDDAPTTYGDTYCEDTVNIGFNFKL